MKEYNLEEFVKNYIEALKALDTQRILDLIDTLTTDEQRIEAFEAVIKVIEADKELLKDNPKMIETLEFIKNVAVAREEAKTEVKAEVATPSVTASPATEEVK